MACTAVEAVLLLSDFGVLGPSRLRFLAIRFGAVWPGLFEGGQPAYPGQRLAMLFSYGLLHAGLAHLVVNMAALLSLASRVTSNLTPRHVAILYLGALVAGGLVFVALTQGRQPMVGASGALFGLLGAVMFWELADRRRAGRTLRPIVRAGFWLVAFNAILYVLLDGALAWEAHLGGFVAGLALAAVLPRRTSPG